MAKDLILPALVEVCGLCKGWGRYSDCFIEGRATVWCNQCDGAQFTYKGTRSGVPKSVQAQIAVMNGFEARKVYALGTVQKVIGWDGDPLFDDWADETRKSCWEISASPWSSEVKADG